MSDVTDGLVMVIAGLRYMAVTCFSNVKDDTEHFHPFSHRQIDVSKLTATVTELAVSFLTLDATACYNVLQ